MEVVFACRLLRTDALGRYEFRTIRPGGYPGSTIPQHIHYEVTAPGYRDYRGELLFADDPRLTGKELELAERARAVETVTRGEGGVQRCMHDVALVRE